MKHKSDIDAVWHINTYCNFDCPYCYCRGINKKKLFRGVKDPQKIVDAFDSSGLSWFIQISGGEPFFHPFFVELCQVLSERHTLAFNTNLSHKCVFDFAWTVDPERIRFIHASVHIEEMERMNMVGSYIKKFKLLEQKGFPIYASYVLYPSFLDRFEKDYQFFKSQGIILWPKLYKGQYTQVRMSTVKGIFRKVNRAIEKFIGKDYPAGFSPEDKERIRGFMARSRKEFSEPFKGRGVPLGTENGLPDLFYDLRVLDGIPCFKGKFCRAGKDFVVISEAGDIRRCHSDWMNLGNIYEGKINLMPEVQTCKVDQCICHVEGFQYLKDINARICADQTPEDEEGPGQRLQ